MPTLIKLSFGLYDNKMNRTIKPNPFKPYGFEFVILLLWVVTRSAIYFQIPIYMDEGIVAFYADRALKDPTTRFDVLNQDKGFLPTLIAAWISGLGFSPFSAVRIYSLVCSALTIFTMYRIAKYLFGANSGKLLLLIYTLSPFNLIHDVVGFLDPGIALVAAVTFYYFIKYIDDKDYRYIIIIGLVLGLGTLVRESSYYFIILFPLSVLVYEIFVHKTKDISRIFLHLILLFVIIYPIYSIKKLTPLSYPNIKPTVENHYLISDFLLNPLKYLNINVLNYSKVLFGYSALIIFVIMISIFTFRNLQYKFKILYIICFFWASTPIVGALLFATVPSSRYITSAYPFLILIGCSIVSAKILRQPIELIKSRVVQSIFYFFATLTIVQVSFMTISLQKYVLPGVDDWQYFRAQQLSGAGIKQIVNKIESISLTMSKNDNPITVLGINSYNNGILAVLLNEKVLFENRQIDIFGFNDQPLADFDFILIEEGNVPTYVTLGWPYFELLGGEKESQLLPLFLNSQFYDQLNLQHQRVFEYDRPRNGTTIALYYRKS
jgi:hypothetical protein